MSCGSPAQDARRAPMHRAHRSYLSRQIRGTTEVRHARNGSETVSDPLLLCAPPGFRTQNLRIKSPRRIVQNVLDSPLSWCFVGPYRPSGPLKSSLVTVVRPRGSRQQPTISGSACRRRSSESHPQSVSPVTLWLSSIVCLSGGLCPSYLL